MDLGEHVGVRHSRRFRLLQVFVCREFRDDFRSAQPDVAGGEQWTQGRIDARVSIDQVP